MSQAWVRIGGVPIGIYGTVSGLEDTGVWRLREFSGVQDIRFNWAAPVRFSAPWLQRNAVVEVVEHGIVTRRGLLSAPVPGVPWQMYARGPGADLEQQQILEGEELVSRADVMARTHATFTADTPNAGDSQPFPEHRTWVVRPEYATLAPDDTHYVSAVAVVYVSHVNTEGEPDAWGITTPTAGNGGRSVALERKFGPKVVTVDAKALGVMTLGQAEAIAAQRLVAGGGRLGWSGEVDLQPSSLMCGNGAPANPLTVREGDTLRLPGWTDPRSQVAYTSTLQITVGELIRYHDERRAVARPVGTRSDDLTSIFADIPAPVTAVETL